MNDVMRARLQYREIIRWYAKWGFRLCCAIVVFVAAFYGSRLYLWAVNEAQAEVAQAVREKDEVYSVLNRKKGMAEHAGRYVVLTSVTFDKGESE